MDNLGELSIVSKAALKAMYFGNVVLPNNMTEYTLLILHSGSRTQARRNGRTRTRKSGRGVQQSSTLAAPNFTTTAAPAASLFFPRLTRLPPSPHSPLQDEALNEKSGPRAALIL
jgi:hypothetical protein